VLYLSPRDYHRVHAPFSGVVSRLRHVPGERWPVFAAAVRGIPRLFEGNERLIIELSTPDGPAAVVLVGALGVSEITTQLAVGSPVAAGDEVGCFGFGSTVIVFHPQAVWQHAGGVVRVGEPLTAARSRQ
jgi:phosphatidylserine decarboxylase